MTNLGPLTTTFTPKLGCGPNSNVNGIVHTSPNGETDKWHTLGFTSTSACYPPNFNPANNAYYSPGICPSDWHSASGGVEGIGAETETRVNCCPSGYSLVNSQATWMTPSCVTVATTSLILSVPNLANDATKITTLGPGVEIHANAVNVRWRRGDFDGSPRASPAETTAQTTADAPRSSSQNTEQSSSKTSANSSPSSSSSSIASQGQNNTTSQTSSSASPASTLSSITSSTASTSASAAPTDLPSGGGLSDGAKAGIGVGVVLAVAAIAALIILLLRKRRRQERAAPEPESPQMVHGNDQRFPPELRAGSQRQTGMQEVHAQSIPHEVDAHRVYQLDGAPMKRAELGSQSPAEMGSYKD